MKYEKPELFPSGSAVAVIQGSGKPFAPNLDNIVGDHTYDCTTPAYEADE